MLIPTTTCVICQHNTFIEKFPNSQELKNWQFKGVQYKYIECCSCSLLMAHPLPNSDTLKSYYNEYYNYGSFASEAPWKKLHSKLRLLYLQKYLKPFDKVLDFGCGHGYFVKETSKSYSSFGYDIGSDSINNTANGSITYSYDFSNFKERNFDLITAWHVLEHIPDTIKVLDELKTCLKPGGILAFAVPNIESLGFQLCGEKWNWVQSPLSHIFHYNSSNLSQLLSNNGFEILKVETKDSLSNNLFDIIVTKLFFKNKSRGSVKISLSSVNSPFYYHLANILRCFFIPFSWLISFKKNSGSELRIIAQKKTH